MRHALGGVSWPGAFVSMVARNRRRYGGYAVHLGVVVLFIGLAGSRAFATDVDVALPQGARADVAGLHARQRGRLELPRTRTSRPSA